MHHGKLRRPAIRAILNMLVAAVAIITAIVIVVAFVPASFTTIVIKTVLSWCLICLGIAIFAFAVWLLM